MECFNPIRLTSRSKFISPCFSDAFVQYVRCGQCAACQDTLSKEWYFRAFQEYKSTIDQGGFMLMDCLTYRNTCVPRVSRYFLEKRNEGNYYLRLPRKLDFMCFDYRDLRLFFVRLRTYLSKRGFDVDEKLRYFAAAEYGTDDNKTHRPHIHVLFYCTVPNLDNYTLSKAISDCWKLGRTDGIPFKSRHYVNEYTIRGGLASSQRACKYVSKYVQKSSAFQKVLAERLSAIMHYIYENRFTRLYLSNDYHFEVDYEYRIPKEYIDWSSYGSFLASEFGKKLYRDLRRKINQFHLQSAGFGAGVLRDLDINEVLKTNILSIPDSSQIVMRIGLPMYYKRKLFYHQVIIDGHRYWQLTDLGKEYQEYRRKDRLNSLVAEFDTVPVNFGLDLPRSSQDLASYLVNKRGCIIGLFEGNSSYEDRINSPSIFFNYNTPSDRSHFHYSFISDEYLGYVGKYNNAPYHDISIDKFIPD